MKWWTALACTIVTVGMITPSFGGGKCCAAAAKEKADAQAAKASSCSSECLSGLTLTDEQHNKVALVMAECLESGCTAESAAEMHAALKTVLTPEQFAQLEAKCAAAGCSSKAGESTEKADS